MSEIFNVPRYDERAASGFGGGDDYCVFKVFEFQGLSSTQFCKSYGCNTEVGNEPFDGFVRSLSS